MMGYLSCKAESSISTADHHHHHHRRRRPEKEPTEKFQEFSYKDLESATNNFSQTKLLGRGSHGLVYKGVLPSGRHVAVKKPSRTAAARTPLSGDHSHPNEVDNEIEILSNLHSPRLVNLIGFTKSDHLKDRLLVVEFMSNGTLYDVLHSNSNSRPSPPNWGRRIKLALQTAKAIETLHSSNPPVIHRDIKSANVLIDSNFDAKLGDFGLALRCVDDHKLRSTPPAGTMGYLDPCYLTPDNLSTKTDVFSFGILLLEIISGRKAIDVFYSPPSMLDWAIPLIRRGKFLSIYDPRVVPPKDVSVRKTLAVVAAKCVRTSRERRPSMREIVECLSELSRIVPVRSWNGFGNPCLVADDVGPPLRSRPDRTGRINNGNPRRVHSELGLRSNLMELMSGPNGESRFLV
ncbi:hypothetical protein ABFS83_14G167900 [Erythranthe nasuta]